MRIKYKAGDPVVASDIKVGMTVCAMLWRLTEGLCDVKEADRQTAIAYVVEVLEEPTSVCASDSVYCFHGKVIQMCDTIRKNYTSIQQDIITDLYIYQSHDSEVTDVSFWKVAIPEE